MTLSNPVLAAGGLALGAVVLIAVLNPGGESQTEPPAVAADQCLASQSSPIELAPAGLEPQELSRDESAESTGADLAAVPEAATFYKLGPESDPAYVVLIPADPETFHAQAESAFEASATADGYRRETAGQSTAGAVRYIRPSDGSVGIYGRQGCYSIIIVGTSRTAAERSASTLLATRSAA